MNTVMAIHVFWNQSGRLAIDGGNGIAGLAERDQ
jgi:hypothetical protein